MQNLLGRVAIGLTGAMLGTLVGLRSVNAFSFDQQEVSQDKFVAIAVPLTQSNSHTLLIIEQISSAQKCWQEDGTQPGVVEPLLLNFDFSGICGRSTDSNGYSIRVAGQDLGLDYKLSVKKRGDALTLVGYSYKDSSKPELQIGRTVQAGSGFLKIELEPGWRFAKRAYEGKTLGHVYLTRDDFPQPATIAKEESIAPQDSETATPLSPEQGDVVNSPEPRDAEVIASTRNKPSKSSVKSRRGASLTPFSKPIPIAVPSPRGAAPKARGIPLSLPKSSSPKSSQRPPLPPAKSSTTVAKSSGPFTTPIQIPVPQPNQPQLTRSPRQYQAPPQSGNLPTLSAGVLPVPSGAIPLGNAQNRSNVYRGVPSGTLNPEDGSPPAPPVRVAFVSHRYRVVVPTNTAQQSELRSLVPDAFRSTYKGQSVLQVGAYRTPDEADEMMQLLSRNGFTGILEKR